MRQVMAIVAVVALGAGSSACATKKFVNTQVGEVNDKVTTLGQQVESTQERVRTAETRIGEVDAKANTAGQRADAASKSADEAKAAATAVDGRITALDKANKRLVYEMVLSDDKSRFKSGKAVLDPAVKGDIDKVVQALAADPKNVYIEIEGHTDSTGSPASNDRLGLQRAEAVKRYLYEQHNVPLHKMNVISFGETKPVAPNKTRDGRAQNRRVVIKVMG